MADNSQSETATPVGKWAPAVALAWLIPGGGHFLLKRPARGAILAACVVLMFLFGLMMRGAMFQWQTGDMLTTVIYCGGFLADLMSGILYLFSRLARVRPAGHGRPCS